MHGGNLGFVAPDGTTTEPGLKVSRWILDAASRVKDSEIVPEPVQTTAIDGPSSGDARA